MTSKPRKNSDVLPFSTDDDGGAKAGGFAGFGPNSPVTGMVNSALASAFVSNLATQPAVAGVLEKIKFSVWSSKIRSWSEFTSKTQFSRPIGVEEALSRLEHNVKYFYANYLLIFLLLTLYTV
eukprot:TRINITY_DN1468_c0_g1_i2.p1 TRINITY_DN1468_c0_g1~~TRINITY_DN1468_c0_g1_i2.p1  ORF type:complete len:123 (-),score=29.63 TRINITY_DN1468_c0_g1_i2:437-805(-)